VLSADVVVVLPGGAGTRTELELARRYGKPVVVAEDLAAVRAFVLAQE
jgi:predicted Rossmann-fold nucleotide-binding protein